MGRVGVWRRVFTLKDKGEKIFFKVLSEPKRQSQTGGGKRGKINRFIAVLYAYCA